MLNAQFFSKFTFFELLTMYTPLDINRENLTIMGIEFPDLKSLESAANAIGSNMFEGFEPTSELVQLYIDLKNKLISDSDFLAQLYRLYGK
ncbi:MAG: hypothetical protein RLZZ91_154 [Bacteroidota bacterium]